MYPTSAVQYGQTSSDVTKLQNFLISQGYSIPAGATGYFGDQTKTALSQWQSSHGISSSTPGYGTNWGPQSISAAQSSNSNQSSNTSNPSSNTNTSNPGTITRTTTPTSNNPYAVQSSWNLSGGNWDGAKWTQTPTLTIDGRNYTFSNPTDLVNALQQMKSSGATNIDNVLPYYQSAAAMKPPAAAQPTTPTPSTSSAPPSVAVQYGQTSNDVKTLQNYLISQGFTIKDGATGYFGDETKAALSQWQASHGINSSTPGYGTNWGPLSISAAQQAANTQSATTTPTNPTTTTTASTGVQTTNGQLPISILGTITGPLSAGSPNTAQVTALQQALVAAGYMTQADMDTGPGTFGPRTKAAVSAWQAVNGLPITGSFDQASATYLQNLNQSAIDGTKTKDTTNTTNPVVSAAEAHAPPLMFQGVAALTPGTPEWNAALDAVNTSMYDVLQQQMTAQTEQEHQVATYNWGKLRDYINTNLGTTLSNDAMQAWTQLQGIKTQFGALNLENSGMQQESMDSYLRNVRANDASQRYQATNKQDEAKQAYYSQYATPEEIQALATSNPALAKSWGIVPSDGLTMDQRTAQMKAQFPNMTTDAIASALAATYDTNGNYRSALYQKYMVGNTAGVQAGGTADASLEEKDQYGNVKNFGPGLTPQDTGILDLQAAKKTNKTATVDAQVVAAQDEQTRAYNQGLPANIAAGPSSNTTSAFDRATTPNTAAGTPPAGSTTATVGNPVPSTNTSTQATPNSYTFKTNNSGMIERYNNGKLESTGTAASMTPYGYK